MKENMSAKGGSAFGGKKIISILVVSVGVLLPMAGLADEAVTTSETNLQMPSDWQPPLESGVPPEGFFVGGEVSMSSGQYSAGPRLIKTNGNETVYWVSSGNLKIAMHSRAVFLSYDNKDEDVATVSQDEFNYYKDAKYIRLNGSGAIYKIDDTTKRQITSDAWNASGLGADVVIDVNKTDLDSYKTGVKVSDSSELASY